MSTDELLFDRVRAKTERTYDKSAWGDGPWQTEPDKAVWIDEATKLVCMIMRTPELGHLCGYVAVLDGPAFDASADDIAVRVHWGLTFANWGTQLGVEGYWVGFDCAHAGDFVPGMAAQLAAIGLPPHRLEVYRDFPYVIGEVESLAEQLAALR